MKTNYIFRVEPDPFTKLFKLIDNDNNRVIEWDERDFEGTNAFKVLHTGLDNVFLDDKKIEDFNNRVKKEMMEYIYENHLDTL